MYDPNKDFFNLLKKTLRITFKIPKIHKKLIDRAFDYLNTQRTYLDSRSRDVNFLHAYLLGYHEKYEYNTHVYTLQEYLFGDEEYYKNNNTTLEHMKDINIFRRFFRKKYDKKNFIKYLNKIYSDREDVILTFHDFNTRDIDISRVVNNVNESEDDENNHEYYENESEDDE